FEQTHVGEGMPHVNLRESETCLRAIAGVTPLQKVEPQRDTVLNWAECKIVVTSLRASYETGIIKVSRVDTCVVTNVAELSRDFINPEPDATWAPWTEGNGQNAAPAPTTLFDKSRCLPPKP